LLVEQHGQTQKVQASVEVHRLSLPWLPYQSK
jgi:hypothetical protein